MGDTALDNPRRQTNWTPERPGAVSPTISDVAADLGAKLGGLLPWIEPALRYLTTDHFGVLEREAVLQSAGALLVAEYTDNHDALFGMVNPDDLETQATAALSAFVVLKARELQIREAARRG